MKWTHIGKCNHAENFVHMDQLNLEKASSDMVVRQDLYNVYIVRFVMLCYISLWENFAIQSAI